MLPRECRTAKEAAMTTTTQASPQGRPAAKRRRGRPRKSAPDADGGAIVQALDRGLRALAILAESNGATLSQIAERTNTPAASVHRVLATLQARGMAEYSQPAGKWFVGPQAFRIGNAYLDRSNMVETAKPILERLAERSGETVNLAVEEDGSLVYIFQVESRNPIRAILKTGAMGDLHSSGIGKVLMAHMEDRQVARILDRRGLPRHTVHTITTLEGLRAEFATIRRRGWAMDNEERFIGMRCVAAPVFNSLGQVAAGISVSGPTPRFGDDRIAGFAAAVVQAAQVISEQLHRPG